jgi:hypothetical protein
MLYETAARTGEILALNIENLDLDAHRAAWSPKAEPSNTCCSGEGAAPVRAALTAAGCVTIFFESQVATRGQGRMGEDCQRGMIGTGTPA